MNAALQGLLRGELVSWLGVAASVAVVLLATDGAGWRAVRRRRFPASSTAPSAAAASPIC